MMIWGSGADEVGRLIGRWWAATTGKAQETPHFFLAWVWNGDIRGAVLFDSFTHDDFTGYNVHAHIHAPEGGFTRHKVKQVMHYVFEFAGCKRMTTIFDARKERLAAVLEKMGFVREGVLADYFGEGKPALLYGLTKRNAERWLNA